MATEVPILLVTGLSGQVTELSASVPGHPAVVHGLPALVTETSAPVARLLLAVTEMPALVTGAPAPLSEMVVEVSAPVPSLSSPSLSAMQSRESSCHSLLAQHVAMRELSTGSAAFSQQ